jgi:hypothetical protein
MTVIATSNVLLFIADDNNNPITGANVFLNGAASGSSASDGTLTVAIPTNGTANIQISANGYQPYTGTATAGSSSVAISMNAITNTASSLSFVIESPGAAYTVSGANSFSDSGTIGTNSSTTVAQYLPGSYSINWVLGTITRTDALNVIAGTTTYSFDPLPIADTSTTSGGVPSTDATPANVTVPPDTSEPYSFSYPAYNYGKYFTPTQAFIYIGDVFIDELVGFQYMLNNNKIPVFGYSSSKMDGLGKGKSIVQGQFNINWVSEGYLYTVLNEYKASTTALPAGDSQAAAITLYKQYLQLSTNNNVGGITSQLVAIRQQLNQLLANNPSLPSILASINSADQEDTPNATYKMMTFDIVMQFEGGGRTIEQIINKCSLTTNELMLSDNDTTVLDSYGFIARSIGYKPKNQLTKPASTGTPPKGSGTVTILPGFTTQ